MKPLLWETIPLAQLSFRLPSKGLVAGPEPCSAAGLCGQMPIGLALALAHNFQIRPKLSPGHVNECKGTFL